jgi:hypothetical protein
MRWVGVPVLMLLLVTVAVLQMPGAWAAQHGRGQPGTLTITHHACERVKYSKVCSWYGDFSTNPDATAGPNDGTAADGTPVRNIYDVEWDDDKHRVGERIPALAEPDGEVYAPHNSHAFDSDVMLAASGGMGLLIWAVLAVRKLRRRRAQPT